MPRARVVPAIRTSGFSVAAVIALEQAILSGARSVSYDGKTVTYASLDDMLTARRIARRFLGMDTQKSETVLVAHDRGYAPRGSADYYGWYDYGYDF